MKIIRKRDLAKWSKVIECTGKGNGWGGCGTLLLIEEQDLFLITRDKSFFVAEDFMAFKCCECNTITDINAPFKLITVPNYHNWEQKRKTK